MENDETPVKQTAVDCLIEQLTKEGIYIPFGFYEQAKKMEKEQIIDAFSEHDDNNYYQLMGHQELAEKYYNDTYGK